MKVNGKQILELTSNNKSMFVFSLVFVFVFSVVLLPLLGKGTYSTEETVEDKDALSVICSETASKGGEVECSVSLNSVSIATKGLTFKYNVADGIDFEEFTSEDFEIYSDSEDGSVLVNLDGVSGNVEIGSVKFTMPVDAVANDYYKIELIDITIGDGADTVLTLENVSYDIRIKSDVNTLNNITLTNGELNEVIDVSTDNNEYSTSVNVDSLTINVTKTDEKSTVLGDGDVELDYGTNTFSLVVTSEDGTDNTYTLKIFRTYELSSDKYVYSSEDNYIYVGTDIDNLLDSIELPVGLSKDIIDNKLVISNDEETLLEADILRINLSNYSVNGDTIYVSDNLMVVDFIDEITRSDVLDLIVSSNGVEVTESVLSGMMLEIYYEDDKLDSYSIDIYSLMFSDNLTIDRLNSFIKYLDSETTISELLNEITVVGAGVYVYDKSGTKKENDDIVATGDVMKIYLGNDVIDEYVLSVIGDSNGDGLVDLIDLVQLRKHIVGWINPNTGEIQRKVGPYYYALDFNGDEIIDLIDLVRMRKKIVGLI